MNDEIKEILDKTKRWCALALDDKCNTIMYKYELVAILDYITTLQEENKKLENLCNKYEKEHSTEFKIWKDERQQLRDYKSRCERIEKCIKDFFCTEKYIRVDGKAISDNYLEILKISQGSDKE